jgi:hypothetical protein
MSYSLSFGEQPVEARTYQKAIGSIVYAALGIRAEITYAPSFIGRYAMQHLTLHQQAVKHLLRYLQSTSAYILMIYDPSMGHDSQQSIWCYCDADLGGEADTSMSTSGIVIYPLRTLFIWKSNTQSAVARSTIQAEMIAIAYTQVQIDWGNDLITEDAITSKGITTRIVNDGLNCVTTHNSVNFQSESRHL